MKGYVYVKEELLTTFETISIREMKDALFLISEYGFEHKKKQYVISSAKFTDGGMNVFIKGENDAN